MAGAGAKKTDAASAAVVETLRKILRADGEERSGLLRRLASEVVELRQRCKYEGRPDWSGRSDEYRDRIYRVYEEAEVPADEVEWG